MKHLDLNLSTLIPRFYLLMAFVIGAGFSGHWWLALLALPVFYSALKGIRFSWPVMHKKSKTANLNEWQHSLIKNNMKVIK